MTVIAAAKEKESVSFAKYFMKSKIFIQLIFQAVLSETADSIAPDEPASGKKFSKETRGNLVLEEQSKESRV